MNFRALDCILIHESTNLCKNPRICARIRILIIIRHPLQSTIHECVHKSMKLHQNPYFDYNPWSIIIHNPQSMIHYNPQSMNLYQNPYFDHHPWSIIIHNPWICTRIGILILSKYRRSIIIPNRRMCAGLDEWLWRFRCLYTPFEVASPSASSFKINVITCRGRHRCNGHRWKPSGRGRP